MIEFNVSSNFGFVTDSEAFLNADHVTDARL